MTGRPDAGRPEVVSFGAASAVTVAGRRIRSLLVPWMTRPADRRAIQFARGSLTEAGPWPLRAAHDSAAPGMPLGLAGVNVAVTDTPAGLALEATLPATGAADDALTLLADGILSGASAEVVYRRIDEATDPPTVTAADLVGAALVPVPAFEQATVEVYAADPGADRDAARRRRVLIAAALA